jgi:hypothetical protein
VGKNPARVVTNSSMIFQKTDGGIAFTGLEIVSKQGTGAASIKLINTNRQSIPIKAMGQFAERSADSMNRNERWLKDNPPVAWAISVYRVTAVDASDGEAFAFVLGKLPAKQTKVATN